MDHKPSPTPGRLLSTDIAGYNVWRVSTSTRREGRGRAGQGRATAPLSMHDRIKLPYESSRSIHHLPYVHTRAHTHTPVDIFPAYLVNYLHRPSSHRAIASHRSFHFLSFPFFFFFPRSLASLRDGRDGDPSFVRQPASDRDTDNGIMGYRFIIVSSSTYVVT